jgi:hypothetical protein
VQYVEENGVKFILEGRAKIVTTKVTRRDDTTSIEE